MNDLNALLDRAAGPAAAPVDAYADLTRGHRALSRTRRRRAAAGLAGVAAAGVVGVGATRALQPEDTAPQHAVERTDTGTGGISFLAQPFLAGPYTFAATPEGWEVQGVTPSAVTIAPVGFADQEPASFLGKLVIMLDGNRPTGERVEFEGRTFWVGTDSDHDTIVTRTRPGEPEGYVLIQFPDSAGWDRQTMLEFLGGVTVGPGAQKGVG
jgi:hypothetical protein